ncbi:peptidase U32 family protein [uncultured Methanobacterium sp.]|uniref:peptidase U32 family protein n=1 Tax=uncultured Methanobacterium sp. TaxID=176306 RepID=UPI002AA71553|nr:peptidase U32 family protein [uncultured Methanobacterium sp.]
MVELLAPARDFAALESALKNGADAVYIGLEDYNMRAHTANFALNNLADAVERCHHQGARLYVCTNTVMRDSDINHLKTVLPKIKASGADAIIASDLGVLKIAREEDVDVHLSVQANISNLESLKLLHELGVKRVILSRELSLNEIKELSSESPIEVEVFIHGAMCLAISGRCFLSSYLYQKNANCGECLQPCRKEWKLICQDENGVSPGSEEDNEIIDDNEIKENNGISVSLGNTQANEPGDGGFKSHILSPRDLCMVEHIGELIDAGISSFKIEGRARPADYVATVTRVYREAIDSYENGEWKFQDRWLDELKKVYNRGFDTGFYFQTPYKTSSYNQATHSKQDIGEVVNYYSKVKAAEIRLWNPLEVGDEIIIQGPTTGSIIQKVKSMQIMGKNIEKSEGNENVGIFVEDKVRPGDLVYRRVERIE